MPNRNPKFKLPLPEVVDPERVCMSVMVPNDPNHVSAFRYAILMLASAYNWADDMDHTAREVAAVWDDVYREVSDCLALMDVRQSEENPCTLEKTEDGEEWVPWADLQLCPPRIRTNKGKLQWFDGSSWVDVPGGGDERYDGEADPQWVDPPAGETGNCLAAENVVASYVTMLTQTKAGLDAVATISGIVDIVAGYIGTQTLFPPALLILNVSIAVGSLAALGSGAIEDMIDSPNVDTLKCIISCHASSDGAFTADEFDAIQDDVSVQIDEPTRLIMSEWLNSYGPVGLTRAAAANGILDGSCDDCDCGWTSFFDFRTDSYSTIIDSTYATYVPGEGYGGKTNGASANYDQIAVESGPMHIWKMDFEYSLVSLGSLNAISGLLNDNTDYGSRDTPTAAPDNHFIRTVEADVTDRVWAFVDGGIGGGATRIITWKIYGRGTKPSVLP